MRTGEHSETGWMMVGKFNKGLVMTLLGITVMIGIFSFGAWREWNSDDEYKNVLGLYLNNKQKVNNEEE